MHLSLHTVLTLWSGVIINTIRYQTHISGLYAMMLTVIGRYLSGLIHCFLRIRLHFVVGMVCNLSNRLLKDRRRLSDWKWCIQVWFTLWNMKHTIIHEHPIQLSEACMRAKRTDAVKLWKKPRPPVGLMKSIWAADSVRLSRCIREIYAFKTCKRENICEAVAVHFTDY